MAKRKQSPMLKKITNKAKALRKKHPTAKWTNLIKQAAKEVKGKKARGTSKRRRVSSVKYIDKGEKKNVTPSKVYRINRTKKGNFKGYTRIAGPKKTVTQILSDAKRALIIDMAQLTAKKLVTVKKRKRNELQKKISAKRSLYNKLK